MKKQLTDSWHGGKGSKPRPITDRKQFDKNWDRIFGNKSQDKQHKEKKNNLD